MPDPTYAGSDPDRAPLMVRADAMRKLFRAGQTVKEVAAHFDVPYRLAYKAIQPPRRSSTDKASTATKPLTKERLANLSKGQLVKIVTSRPKTPAEIARVEAVSNELDRRYPGWVDDL